MIFRAKKCSTPNQPKYQRGFDEHTQLKIITKEILSQDEITLLEMLKASPKSSYEIRTALHCKDSAVRRLVNKLRVYGYPICSSVHSKGYWFGNNQDIQTTIAEYHSRIDKMIQAVNGLNHALSECPMQYGECAYLCENCERKCR